jgi:hypothetical protein
MKSLVVRLSLTIFAFAIAVFPARAEEWSKTYNISGKPELRVETSDANIRVTTWDQNTIEAKVITTRYKIGEDGIRVEEHQTGDSVEIDVHYPHHNFNVDWGSHKVEIIIQMPREGKVNFRTGDGKIEVAGLKGEMDTARDDRGWTHTGQRPFRRTRAQDRRRTCRRAGQERLLVSRKLAAGNGRRQRLSGSPGRPRGGC